MLFFWVLSFESDEIEGSKEKGYFHVLLFLSVMVKKGRGGYHSHHDQLTMLFYLCSFYGFFFSVLVFGGVVFDGGTWSKRDGGKHTRINQRMWVMIRFWR